MDSSAPTKEIHLKNRNKPVIAKTNMRRMIKVRAKRNGIIIIQQINIQTLLKMGMDCEMIVICRRLSEISRDTLEKEDCSQEYTLCR